MGRVERHAAPATIGALTRRDRRRESVLVRKVDTAYRDMAAASSRRRRRHHLREARRHERALSAHRRRPQSLLVGLALVLALLLGATVLTHASLTFGAAVAAVLAVDVGVLRWRRRALRSS